MFTYEDPDQSGLHITSKQKWGSVLLLTNPQGFPDKLASDSQQEISTPKEKCHFTSDVKIFIQDPSHLEKNNVWIIYLKGEG